MKYASLILLLISTNHLLADPSQYKCANTCNPSYTWRNQCASGYSCMACGDGILDSQNTPACRNNPSGGVCCKRKSM